jgi:hypothetical protein
MVARSWAERLAQLPMPEDQLVDGLARTIYMTHRRESAPTWEKASDAVRDWVRAQAQEGLTFLRALRKPAK